jgi:hypothetical protein
VLSEVNAQAMSLHLAAIAETIAPEAQRSK